MARNIVFENHQPYHILNRGIDKRIIFQDTIDFYRFIFLLYACNFGSPASNLWRRDVVKAGKAILAGEKPPSKFIQKEHKQLVDILAITLLPNHYHSILAQRMEGGISIFMQKVGVAYSKYFNLRYQRSGRLFQGPFKAILISDENYLLRLLRYIYLNVLDIFQPDWRKRGIKNKGEALKILNNYRWSSHADYLGIRDAKLITTKGVYNTFFDNFSEEGRNEYEKFLMQWTDKELKKIDPFILESDGV